MHAIIGKHQRLDFDDDKQTIHGIKREATFANEKNQEVRIYNNEGRILFYKGFTKKGNPARWYSYK